MSVEGKKKIAVKAAELKEAIKEELQAEKQEAIQFVHELKDAAHSTADETKEKIHDMIETAKKNMHDKTEKLVQRKDEVVTVTAETLEKAINHTKCTLISNKCKEDNAVSAKEETEETDPGLDKIYPI